jgi:hypothetical protein
MNIRELAEQAGWDAHHVKFDTRIERFAELVAAHTLMNIDPSKFIGGYQEGFEAGVAKEREECAKVCDERVSELYASRDTVDCAEYLAGQIRARSKA